MAGGSETDARITGSVVYSDGTPAAGARIDIYKKSDSSQPDAPDSTLIADANGKFIVDLNNGRYVFEYTAPNDRPGLGAISEMTIRTETNKNSRLDTTLVPKILQPRGVLKVHIVDFNSADDPNGRMSMMYQGVVLKTSSVNSTGVAIFSASSGTYDLGYQPGSSLYLSLSRHGIEVVPGDTTLVTIKSLLTVSVVANDPRFIQDSLVVRAILDSMGLRNSVFDVIGISDSLRVSELRLRGRSISKLPGSIAMLSELTILDLRENNLSSIPVSVGDLTKLTSLLLDRNQLSAIPSSLGKLRSLKLLRAGENRLSSLPMEIGRLAELEELTAPENLMVSIPDSIGKLRTLRVLNLSTNRLVSLPATLEGLSALDILMLHNNNLDSLPEALTSCKNLSKLTVQGNSLGTLPLSLGNLTNLEMLWADDNQITGLPESIVELSKLKYLLLDRNEIDSLPDGIGRLTRLNQLSLQENKLRALPDSIRSIPFGPKGLNIRSNRLCAIPQSMEQWLTSIDPSWKSGQNCTSLPPIRIISPNGGERYAPGDIITIQWEINESQPLGSFVIELSYDGVNFTVLAGNFRPASKVGIFTYAVDASGPFSTNCIVRVKPYFGVKVEDESDAPFTISPPNRTEIVFTKSLAGGVLSKSDTLEIAWSAPDPSIIAVSCSLSTDNGLTWNYMPGADTVQMRTPQWGLVKWPISAGINAGYTLTSTTCKIKISDFVSCRYYKDCKFAISEGTFTIK